MTAGPGPNTIGFVMSQAAQMLTKRRAVDFCHVATAICPRPAALSPALAARVRLRPAPAESKGPAVRLVTGRTDANF